MFPESKVVEIYCMADDFCKEFALQQEKYMIEDKKTKHRNKPNRTDDTNCYYGSHTVSDGCGGTCTKCYPACKIGYFYDFSMADCFVRPAVIIRDPGNPNCAKCECDNSDCRYPNGSQCECAYI
jgi:hypothetical protein